jgi:hypothetical protein
MIDRKKNVSNVEEIVKGTHVFEAGSRVGIDSARFVLKGNRHALYNAGCQTDTKHTKHRNTKENEASGSEQGNTGCEHEGIQNLSRAT